MSKPKKPNESPTESGWYWYNDDMAGDPEYSVIVHVWYDGDKPVVSFPGLTEVCALDSLTGAWGERIPSNRSLGALFKLLMAHRSQEIDLMKNMNDLIFNWIGMDDDSG